MFLPVAGYLSTAVVVPRWLRVTLVLVSRLVAGCSFPGALLRPPLSLQSAGAVGSDKSWIMGKKHIIDSTLKTNNGLPLRKFLFYLFQFCFTTRNMVLVF